MMTIRTSLLVFAFFMSVSNYGYCAEISAIFQANWLTTDGHISWQEKGTGILRDGQSGVNLQQAALHITQDIGADFGMDLVANYYHDGEQHLGLTQAQIIYMPLSQKPYRFRARAGFFYPKMSLENVDAAWLSPYTYTQSAINSWIGEELRTTGLEFSVVSPGRIRNSAWSWQLHVAGFKSNDPIGAMLSWRGFAMHDRQSLHNDRVEFARYPSVISQEGLDHPSWTESFHELDGRIGYYLGLHIDYYKRSSLRCYFYDNQADPLAINDLRLYGWRTKFHSLALQHKFSNTTRMIAQGLKGSTLMGGRFVYVDYEAWYLMLSHKIDKHRISVRYDHFDVDEDDIFVFDPNNSNGHGLTAAWRYNWKPNWQLGLEWHKNQSHADNRALLSQPLRFAQQQAMAVLQYRW